MPQHQTYSKSIQISPGTAPEILDRMQAELNAAVIRNIEALAYQALIGRHLLPPPLTRLEKVRVYLRGLRWGWKMLWMSLRGRDLYPEEY